MSNINKIEGLTLEERKLRLKIFNNILNKSQYSDQDIILIKRGHLYMSICDLAEEVSKN